MSIIAAFYWTKSPRHSISTLIFDDETVDILSPAKIDYLPQNDMSFQKAAKLCIQQFFSEISKLNRIYQQPISVEFKIVFKVHEIFYMQPSDESQFVYDFFNKIFKQTKSKIKSLKLRPQLRKRLSGKSLKHFKKELRTMALIIRKRNTGYQYHLWALALHATNMTYLSKLKKIKKNLFNRLWQQYH
jgi:hypothetical protein